MRGKLGPGQWLMPDARETTGIPDDTVGVPIRPIRHPRDSFWDRRSAIDGLGDGLLQAFAQTSLADALDFGATGKQGVKDAGVPLGA